LASAFKDDGIMYDEASISAEFRALAAKADNEFEDHCRATDYAQDGDEILARSCVYGCLYDRYFLETGELLLNELRWLKQTGRPHAPSHCKSAESFGEHRERVLESLIARFDVGPARR
jgi:hypothetical protein